MFGHLLLGYDRTTDVSHAKAPKSVIRHSLGVFPFRQPVSRPNHWKFLFRGYLLILRVLHNLSDNWLYIFAAAISKLKTIWLASAIEQQDSYRPPFVDGGMAKEEFIRVGTTLYKIVEQTEIERGMCEETHRMEQRDQDRITARITRWKTASMTAASAPYPNNNGYRSVVGKFLNLRTIDYRTGVRIYRTVQSLVRYTSSGEQYELGEMDYLQLLCNPFRSCSSCCYRKMEEK